MLLGKQLYITSGEIVKPECFVGARNCEDTAFIKKPWRGTGLWTSTWREGTRDSAWVEWCRWNDFEAPYEKQWYILVSKEDINLYVIDKLTDLQGLMQDYGWMPPLFAKRNDGLLLEHFRGIDFERLALEYDGIWLTEQGNNETHLSYPHNLYGWDCESMLWFHWCFTEVQRIAVPEPVSIEE